MSRFAAIVTLTAALAGGALVPPAAAGAATPVDCSARLWYSTSASRADAQPLQDAVLTGPVHVFVAGGGDPSRDIRERTTALETVRFTLRPASGLGSSPIEGYAFGQIEQGAPFDFMRTLPRSGGRATPWETSRFPGKAPTDPPSWTSVPGGQPDFPNGGYSLAAEIDFRDERACGDVNHGLLATFGVLNVKVGQDALRASPRSLHGLTLTRQELAAGAVFVNPNHGAPPGGVYEDQNPPNHGDLLLIGLNRRVTSVEFTVSPPVPGGPPIPFPPELTAPFDLAGTVELDVPPFPAAPWSAVLDAVAWPAGSYRFTARITSVGVVVEDGPLVTDAVADITLR